MNPTKLTSEAKVGMLVFGAAALAVLFAWIIGLSNPFKKSFQFYVTYRFAGGIEVGSPVRLSGIKVGRVEEIDFFTPATGAAVSQTEPGSDPGGAGEQVTPVRLRISMLEKAAVGVRKDSRFYINMAGIIGERYLEITPGTSGAGRVEAGDVVVGVDPPRIDQLISQSFDLAGRLTDLVEKNKGDITRSIDLLYKLSVNINNTVTAIDKSHVFKSDLGQLVNNLITLTGDVGKLTKKFNSPELDKTLDLMHQLLWRLEPLDAKTMRKFLQEEGIRTKIF
ncbi:MAG: MlaD family protein [Bacteriovoracia bacterium]